jgi:hypothetical protein
MNKITDKTLIPLSLVITVLGGVVWLSMMFSKVEAQEKKIDKQDGKIESQTAILIDIRERVIRIEEKQRK